MRESLPGPKSNRNGPRTTTTEKGRLINILHVAASVAPRYGGPAVAVVGMTQALSAAGHQVDVLTSKSEVEDPSLGWVTSHGVRTRHLSVVGPEKLLWWPDLPVTLRRLLPSVDVVEVHGVFGLYAAVTARLCRRAQVPYVLRPQGALEPYQRSHHATRKRCYHLLSDRHLVSGASAVHYTSVSEMDGAVALHPAVEGYVIALGAVPDNADRSTSKPDWWPTAAGLIIAFLGRIASKKRIDLLLRAFADATSDTPDAILVVAGPDDDGLRDGYKAQAESLGISGRVIWPGTLSGGAKYWLLQECDVFVLPSDNENFSVALAEALSFGRPVVTTTGVALHHMVRECSAGAVVPPGSAAALTRALRALVIDQDARARAGAAALALAPCFSWPRCADALAQMYSDVTRASRRRAA